MKKIYYIFILLFGACTNERIQTEEAKCENCGLPEACCMLLQQARDCIATRTPDEQTLLTEYLAEFERVMREYEGSDLEEGCIRTDIKVNYPYCNLENK